MIVWMRVSRDKYELPVAVADSKAELAKQVGVLPQSIICAISHAKKDGTRCIYKKVEVEDDDDDLILTEVSEL